jgi:hypothetical protein
VVQCHYFRSDEVNFSSEVDNFAVNFIFEPKIGLTVLCRTADRFDRLGILDIALVGMQRWHMTLPIALVIFSSVFAMIMRDRFNGRAPFSIVGWTLRLVSLVW